MRINKENYHVVIHYSVDKRLFCGKYRALNNDARMLYAFIVDRVRLSIQNNWIDEKGDVFVKISRKRVMYEMSLSQNTVKKAFDSLKNINLIEKKQQYRGLVDLIYPHLIEEVKGEQIEFDIADEEKDLIEELAAAKNSALAETEKSPSKKRETYIAELKQKIDYDIFNEWLDDALENGADKEYAEINKNLYTQVTDALFACCLTDKPYFIRGDKKTAKELRLYFNELKAEHVWNVVESLKNVETEKINNKQSYIISCLYNAPGQYEFDKALLQLQAARDLKKLAF